MGEALKQMADVKYSLDDNIKQSFLEPLHHLQTKDLKEVMVRILSLIHTPLGVSKMLINKLNIYLNLVLDSVKKSFSDLLLLYNN